MSASPGLGLQGPRTCPAARLERKQVAVSAGCQELPGLHALGMRAWEKSVPRIGLKCCWRVRWGFPLGVPTEVPLHLLYLVFLTPPSGLHETLALLTSQLRPDSNHKEEMGFLQDVFSEKSLGYLMKVEPRFLPSGEGF